MFLYFAADTYHLLSDVFLGSITISTKKKQTKIKPKTKTKQRRRQVHTLAVIYKFRYR